LGCVSLARGAGGGNGSQEVKTLGSQAISGDRRWWGPHVGPIMWSRAFRRFPVSHAERAVSTAHSCDWAGVWFYLFIYLFNFPGGQVYLLWHVVVVSSSLEKNSNTR
jgi:hypothetical protein